MSLRAFGKQSHHTRRLPRSPQSGSLAMTHNLRTKTPDGEAEGFFFNKINHSACRMYSIRLFAIWAGNVIILSLCDTNNLATALCILVCVDLSARVILGSRLLLEDSSFCSEFSRRRLPLRRFCLSQIRWSSRRRSSAISRPTINKSIFVTGGFDTCTGTWCKCTSLALLTHQLGLLLE